MTRYYSALLSMALLGACHSPQVDSLTQPSQTSTHHLTAFSRDSLPAQDGRRLAEVHLNGRRYLKYIYQNGYLTDEITYSADERDLYLSTSHYNRDQHGLLKIETRGRTYEEGVVGSDTTRLLYAQMLSRSSDLVIAIGSTNLLFSSNGSLLKQTNQYATTTYAVDANNNVDSATTAFNDGYPNTKTITTYQYDTRLNPFQTTGRVFLRSKFSTFETDYSPNNVTEANFYNLATQYKSAIHYSYTYRSDGYPSQVVLDDSRESTNKSVLEFIYTK